MLFEIDDNDPPFVRFSRLIFQTVIKKNASEAVIEAAGDKTTIKVMVGETLETFMETRIEAYDHLLNCFTNMANWPPIRPLKGESEPFCLSYNQQDFLFKLSIISTGSDGPENRSTNFDKDYLDEFGEALGDHDGPIPRISRLILKEMVTKNASEAVIETTPEKMSVKILVSQTPETIYECPVRAFDKLLRRFKYLANWLPTQPQQGRSQSFRFRHDKQEFFFTIFIPPIHEGKSFRITTAPAPKWEFRLLRV
ncbi:MAG: hypothetical protein HQM09_20895 [Candidatus Riflebacteria bacterium]|nr:hypothetical protein [Candidatus Riflebacteria bacterium]